MSNFVSKKGRIEYIEPNNINLASDDFATKMAGDTAIPYPYEDYSMAIDLYVKKSRRDSCGQPDNNGNSNGFTDIIHYNSKSGKANVESTSFFQGTNGWLTANFTDIDCVNPVGNTSECLGITNISIKYQNIFMPVVTINFVDVRGASLFSKEEKGIYDRKVTGTNTKKNNRISEDNINGSNLYKTLFMFPYPMFTLVVKGIYGDSVSYNLSITNVKTSFNESSGDFEISVDFVGTLFGVLADIPMTFLAIAPYIEQGGKSLWEDETMNDNGRFKMVDAGKNQTPMKKYLDLIKLEATISDKIKKDFDSNEDVKKFKKYLADKHTLSMMKFPLTPSKDSSTQTNVWYCNKDESKYVYYYIGRGFSENVGKDATWNMSKNMYYRLQTFNTQITNANETLDNKLITLDGSYNLLDTYSRTGFYEYDNSVSNNYPILTPSYKITRTYDEKNKKPVFTCIDNLTTNNKERLIDISELEKKFPRLGNLRQDSKLNDTTNKDTVYLYLYQLYAKCDYDKVRHTAIDALNKKIKSMQETIEGLKKNALVSAYGFSPNIANMYGLNFAHLETFMNTFYKCLSDIADKKPVKGGIITDNSRTIKSYGVNVEKTDLNPEKYSDDDAFLPPFVSFYEHNIETNNDEIIWPGKLDNLKNLEEVKYVERIIDAISTYTDDKEALDSEINPNTQTEKAYLATSLYEYVLKSRNPYREVLKYIDKANVIDCLVLIYALRFYYFSMFYGPDYATLGGKQTDIGQILKLFAYSEANNFTKVIGKSKSVEVIENILNVYDNYSKDSGEIMKCLTGERKCDLYPVGGKVFEKYSGSKKINGKTESRDYLRYSWLKKKLPGIDEVEQDGKTIYNKENKHVFDETLDDGKYENREFSFLPISGFNFKTIKEDYTNNVIASKPGYINYILANTQKNSEKTIPAYNLYNEKTFIHLPKPKELTSKLNNYIVYKNVDTGNTENEKTLKEDENNVVGDYHELLLSKFDITVEDSGKTFSDLIAQDIKTDDDDDKDINNGSILYNLGFNDISTQSTSNDIHYSIKDSCLNACFSNIRNIDSVKIETSVDDDDAYEYNIFYHELYYNQNLKKYKNGEDRSDNIKILSKAYLFLFSLVNKRNDFLKGYCSKTKTLPEGVMLKTELLKEGAFWWRMEQMFNGNTVTKLDEKGVPVVKDINRCIVITGTCTEKDKQEALIISEAEKDTNLYTADKKRKYDLKIILESKEKNSEGTYDCQGIFMWDPLYINNKKYKEPGINEIFYVGDEKTIKSSFPSDYPGITYIKQDTKKTKAKYLKVIPDECLISDEMCDVLRYLRTETDCDLDLSISRVRYLIDMFKNWALGEGTEYLGKKANTSFKAIMDTFEIRAESGKRSFDFTEKIDNIGDGNKSVKIADLLQNYLYTSYKGTISDTNIKYNDRNLLKGNDSYLIKLMQRDDKNIISAAQSKYDEAHKLLLNLLLDTDFVFDASRFFNQATSNNDGGITVDGLNSSFSIFMEKIKEFGYKIDESDNIKTDKFSKDDLKLSLYLKLKNLYDRWLCSYDRTHWSYIPKTTSENTIENDNTISSNIVYLDTFYNKIGDKLLVDLTKYCNIIKKYTTTASSGEKNINKNLNNDTMITLMSDIASDSNCMMLCLPFMFGMDGYNNLQSVFVPKDFNSIDKNKDTSTFAVVYKPNNSQHTDNGDDYENDGFDIADSLGNINPVLPSSIIQGVYNYDENDKTKIPAFGVTFGKQNQSYFNSIKINSDRVQMTDYSIKAMQNVISESQTGAKNVYSYGQDIYDMYSNYVYSCSISMMGCMRITPLMFFQLNNIPMFHGAYSITSVSHSISPGSVTTTFEGTRMSKRQSPIASGELVVLNTSSWGLEEYAQELSNLDEIWNQEENSVDILSNEELIDDIMVTVDEEAKKDVNKFIETIMLSGSSNYVKNTTKPDNKVSVANVYAYAYYFMKNKLKRQYGDQYLRYVSICNDKTFDNNIKKINYPPHKTDTTKEFKELMESIKYEKINIGTNIYGREIVNKIDGLELQTGDILVYYATSNDEEERETLKGTPAYKKTKLNPGDVEYEGAAQFFYNRREQGVDYNYMSYNRKNDGKNFIFDTNKKRPPEYFRWNVDLYRHTDWPIGRIISKENGELTSDVSGLTFSADTITFNPKDERCLGGKTQITIVNKECGREVKKEGEPGVPYGYDTCFVKVEGTDKSGLIITKEKTLALTGNNDKSFGYFAGIAETAEITIIDYMVFGFYYKGTLINTYTYIISGEIGSTINIEAWTPDAKQEETTPKNESTTK